MTLIKMDAETLKQIKPSSGGVVLLIAVFMFLNIALRLWSPEADVKLSCEAIRNTEGPLLARVNIQSSAAIDP